jgi:hypothetical protein
LGKGVFHIAAERGLGQVFGEGVNGHYAAKRAVPVCYLKRIRLYFAVFIVEMPENPKVKPDRKLFCQKRPLKANQAGPRRIIFYIYLERFHVPCTEPLVRKDFYLGTDLSPAPVTEGNKLGTVFPVPGIMAEQGSGINNAQAGKKGQGFGAYAFDGG